MEKIKLLVCGDFISPTGFSRVLMSICKFLPLEDYSISVLAVNYFGDPHNLPYRVYPASNAGDIYGINRLRDITDWEKPDVIFILNDSWVQVGYLAELKRIYKDRTMPKIATYTPVDAKHHQPAWYQHFDIVDVPVAYTMFGYKEIISAKPDLADRLTIIQHGVDTDIFNRLVYNAKEKVFAKRPICYDEDAFIVLNANRNQKRKRLELTMKGFALFADGKPDNVKLYFHSGVEDAGHINSLAMAHRFDITDRFIVTAVKNGIPGVPDNILNEIYNSCNVGINTSLGEGWGLPNIEHACTGAVQVVPNHSACKELFKDCGILIPTTMEYVIDDIMTTGYLVSPENVAKALQFLYDNRGLMKQLAQKGKEKFSSEEFSWKYIATKWDEIFKTLMKG